MASRLDRLVQFCEETLWAVNFGRPEASHEEPR
jgi:hypothetical protein